MPQESIEVNIQYKKPSLVMAIIYFLAWRLGLKNFVISQVRKRMRIVHAPPRF